MTFVLAHRDDTNRLSEYRSAMKTRAAVAYEVNGPWVVDEFELREPGPDELLVKMSYACLLYTSDAADE